MDKQIITRKEAMAKGLKRYFTGVPCKHGHISEKLVKRFNCCECSRLRTRLEYKKNPDKAKSYSKEWRKNNPEKVAEQKRRHYRTDKGKFAQMARSQKWLASNREKHNTSSRESSKRWRAKKTSAYKAWKMRYYSRKRNAYGSFSKEDLQHIISTQSYKCNACHVDISHGYHVDHIMPLSKGGDNTKDNIQVLCRLCNSRKKDKHPDVWANEVKAMNNQ